MEVRASRLGVLISAGPEHANFRHGLGLAEAALDQGVRVYLYCIDDAVRGLTEPRLQALTTRGLNLYGCAYSVRQRNLAMGGEAAFSGLAALAEIISAMERFVAFNP